MILFAASLTIAIGLSTQAQQILRPDVVKAYCEPSGCRKEISLEKMVDITIKNNFATATHVFVQARRVSVEDRLCAADTLFVLVDTGAEEGVIFDFSRVTFVSDAWRGPVDGTALDTTTGNASVRDGRTVVQAGKMAIFALVPVDRRCLIWIDGYRTKSFVGVSLESVNGESAVIGINTRYTAATQAAGYRQYGEDRGLLKDKGFIEKLQKMTDTEQKKNDEAIERMRPPG